MSFPLAYKRSYDMLLIGQQKVTRCPSDWPTGGYMMYFSLDYIGSHMIFFPLDHKRSHDALLIGLLAVT